jgi:hypothetical protein
MSQILSSGLSPPGRPVAVSEKMRVFDLEQPRTTEMPIHPAHRQAGYSYLLC